MNKLLFFFLSAAICIASCDEEINTPSKADEPNLNIKYHYSSLELPFGLITNFPSNINNGGPDVIIVKDPGFVQPPSQAVKVSDAGAMLGRVLFYDKQMSINNAISCGSCHLQEKAFSDGKAISTGFKGIKTSRNSMAILNPIMQNNLFWDSRSHTIHDLTLLPVQNHIEMGMEDLNYLEDKLSNLSYYKPLFKEAFNSEVITKEKISEAMAQFIASITSSNSRFDTELRSQMSNSNSTSTLTSLEQHGRALFFGNKAKCSGCHAGNNFSAPDGQNDEYGGGIAGGANLRGTTNIGLDLLSKDLGRKDGSFKIPSLRNIEVTGPYMHDGRFETLDEVLDHYTSGIKANANLDKKFKDARGNPKGLDLTTYDKKALIAFLKTLTDEKFLREPKYGDPFQ